MHEASDIAIVLIAKVVRAMVFWVALYVVEKAYQDAYVQHTLLEDGTPPDLRWLTAAAIGIDIVITGILAVITFLIKKLFKTPSNTFILDNGTMRIIGIDYACSTAVILAMGTLLSQSAQSAQLFRYRDNGVRGIRAFCNMLLYVSFVGMAIPYYRLV
jgi:hypothetical protein